MNRHPWLEYKNWAVIGASRNKYSYGYRITQKLLNQQYHTVPISPKYDMVLGELVYNRLTEYEGAIDVVDFVVNPSIGIQVLDDVIAKGVKRILLQPDTASQVLIEKARAHGIEVLEGCVLVLLAWQG